MQVEISFIRVTRVLSCHFRFRIYQCKRLLINGTSALFLTSSGWKVIAINHVCFYYLLEEFKVFPRSSRHVSHEMDLSVLHWNENQFNLFYLQINCPRALFDTSEKQIYVVVLWVRWLFLTKWHDQFLSRKKNEKKKWLIKQTNKNKNWRGSIHSKYYMCDRLCVLPFDAYHR